MFQNAMLSEILQKQKAHNLYETPRRGEPMLREQTGVWRKRWVEGTREDHLKGRRRRCSHSSALVWRIPRTEEPRGLQSMGSLRVGHDWATSLSRIGEGKGNPLQCSRLENPRDGGAWWAAIYGVTQSWTRLKWLSNSNINSGTSNGLIFISL